MGALIVGVFNSGLRLAGVDVLWQVFAIGWLTIIAVASTSGSGRCRHDRAQKTSSTDRYAMQPLLTARSLVKRYGRVTALNRPTSTSIPARSSP